MAKKTHAAKVGAGKWNLGQALCGCTISRWTPTSRNPEEVTCPRCRAKMANASARPVSQPRTAWQPGDGILVAGSDGPEVL